MRINKVISELNGEKVDVVLYSDNSREYIVNALSPAEVSDLMIDEENKSCVAIVPDSKLSLAIGKDGQNVRLAVKLTGWKIDVKSESQYNNNVNVDESDDFSDLSDADLFEDIE